MANQQQIYIFQLNHIIFPVCYDVTRQIKFMKILLFFVLVFMRWQKENTAQNQLKLEAEILFMELLERKLESISIHNDNCLFA